MHSSTSEASILEYVSLCIQGSPGHAGNTLSTGGVPHQLPHPSEPCRVVSTSDDLKNVGKKLLQALAFR